jgi:hypothetical protein
MTRRKTLKQRVRARMAKTGERYTAALSHFRSVEQLELEVPFTELAVEGLACPVRWWKHLKPPTPPLQAELTRTLRALRGEPSAVLFTGAAIEGRAEAPLPSPGRAGALLAAIERFSSGVRGFSRDGRHLALELGGAPVMLSVQAVPRPMLAVIGLEALVVLLPRLRKLEQVTRTPLADFAALQSQFEHAGTPEVLEASGLFTWLG